MGATERPPALPDPDEPPAPDLEYLYDDRDDPSELTIFSPAGRRMVTEWVTADVTTAVSLDGMR